MREFFRKLACILGLFRCPVCDEGDGGGRGELCPPCQKALALLPVENRCRGCGGVNDNALALCTGCLRYPQRQWSDAITLMEYCKRGRTLIEDYKFRNHPELARPLGILAAEAIRKARWQFDLLIPVPLHWSRRLRRGYNQAELFAEVIGGELGKPVVAGLVRPVRGAKQSTLNRTRRRSNPKRLFRASHTAKWQGKSIVLVDDIITTGATLEAAAKILRKEGAGEIRIITAARTPLYIP